MNGTTRSILRLDPSTTDRVTLERTGSEVEYQFAVSGTVIKSLPNCNDRVYGRRVLGTAGVTADRYQYTGNITALAVTSGSPGDLAIYADGGRKSATDFPSHPAG